MSKEIYKLDDEFAIFDHGETLEVEVDDDDEICWWRRLDVGYVKDLVNALQGWLEKREEA